MTLPGLAAAEPEQPNLIPAPDDPGQWAQWRRELVEWRAGERRRLNYDDALYRRTDFAWTASSFACCFLMLCDETFYDRTRDRYRVEEFLEEGVREFGGFDSMVLWHAYPRIGLDERNQFDFYREMPGGLAGLRDVVERCHRRGVRAFINYNPWDTGTRREPLGDVEALAAMVRALDVDGIFLDTLNRGEKEFRPKLDGVRRGVVLESEIALPVGNIYDHHMSWAQWFKDSRAPGVLRNKWFERRHMLHQIDRWSRDHSGELQTAWMNGTGMMVWENVFGTWIGWSKRDKLILRSMLPVQRRYASVFSGEQWTPLVEGTLQRDLFASLWEGSGLRLWTLVNRGASPVDGTLLSVEHREGDRYFDLIGGVEVRAQVSGGRVELDGAVGPRGVGGFVAGRLGELGGDLVRFLKAQRGLAERASADVSFPTRNTALKPPPGIKAGASRPQAMVSIRGSKYLMRSQFRIREPGFYESVHPHFAGSGGHALHKPMFFERNVELQGYAIDRSPVTNAQYAEFLRASGYRPRHKENFLRHWVNGEPVGGREGEAVVWVDLDDARAYAGWAGKRLPLEEEWQYAAEQPKVLERVGEVWEWTESERSDGRTRWAILKGGSKYEAKGSAWYMDGGPKPVNFAVKFLMMWPALDRCETVGFRCAKPE
jgi:hypothetical protein